jgi:uncharacterized membrane protein
MVGITTDVDGAQQGFLWLFAGGTIQLIKATVLQTAFDNSALADGNRPERVTNTTAEGINDVGQVVGRFDTKQGNEFGYLLQLKDPYQPPTAEDFTVFSAARILGAPSVGQRGVTESTDATGINKNGDICGLTYTNVQSDAGSKWGFLMHALDTTNPVRTDLIPPDQFVELFGISVNADVVGCFNDANTHAFMLPAGSSSPISRPFYSPYSRAQGINSHGRVVGRTTNGGPTNPQSQSGFAFIWDSAMPKGLPTPFEYPSAKSTYANGINDFDVVVGEYREAADPKSPSHGFVGYPTLPSVPGMPRSQWPRWRISRTQVSSSISRATREPRKGAKRKASKPRGKSRRR